MQRSLIVSPQGGMGNRLRAMASAMVLARQIGREFLHTWTPTTPSDSRLYIRPLQQFGFEGLFVRTDDFAHADKQNVPVIDVCFSEWLRGDYWYERQSHAQKYWDVVPFAARYENPADRIAQCRAEVILLETSHAVRLGREMGGCATDKDWESKVSSAYATFVPRPKYKSIIENASRADVGIAIRRGDRLQFSPPARQSLPELTEWVIAISRRRSVAIFSDDLAVRNEMRRAILQAGGKLAAPLDTEKLADWETAFAEFLYLATNCSMISGTPTSSFAREASLFGGKPYFYNLTALEL